MIDIAYFMKHECADCGAHGKHTAEECATRRKRVVPCSICGALRMPGNIPKHQDNGYFCDSLAAYRSGLVPARIMWRALLTVGLAERRKDKHYWSPKWAVDILRGQTGTRAYTDWPTKEKVALLLRCMSDPEYRQQLEAFHVLSGILEPSDP